MSTVTTYLNLVKPASPEQFSLATYNNNLDLVDANAVTGGKKADGLKSLAEVTATSGPHTDGIVSNIASFTFKGGRKYRIVWDASFIIGDATTFYYLSIGTCLTTDSASIITGITALNGRTIQRPALGTFYSGAIVAYFNPASDTTVQLKFRAARVGGSATATVGGSAGEKAVYAIYDDGAQF